MPYDVALLPVYAVSCIPWLWVHFFDVCKVVLQNFIIMLNGGELKVGVTQKHQPGCLLAVLLVHALCTCKALQPCRCLWCLAKLYMLLESASLNFVYPFTLLHMISVVDRYVIDRYSLTLA